MFKGRFYNEGVVLQSESTTGTLLSQLNLIPSSIYLVHQSTMPHVLIFSIFAYHRYKKVPIAQHVSPILLVTIDQPDMPLRYHIKDSVSKYN